MEKKPAATGDVVVKLATPIVVWALSKLVEAPRIQKALKGVDKRYNVGTKQAKRNAQSNRALVAAGAAAVVLGVGLLARGAVKR